MTKPLILVTGATGTVGSEVVRQLVEKGERVRVLTRDPTRAEKFGRSIEVIQGDLGKPETLGAAFTGADNVFVLSNYPSVALFETNAYAAAKAAGAKRIVKLSGRHTNTDWFSATAVAQGHIMSEQRLQTLGVPWTILRPGTFASNFFLFFNRENNGVFLQIGEGKESFIDPRDIGACAVALLTTPGHDGRIYEITGSEDLSYAQCAEKLSAAAGRTIVYQDIPADTLRQGLLAMGLPAPIVESFLRFFAAVRDGKTFPPTSAVADLLGRPPRSFDEWARDNAAAFQ
jgi:(4-alkanoyl-5-oxo-2,5-dihydrofuran-3-yl)methyl phosphate reductase